MHKEAKKVYSWTDRGWILELTIPADASTTELRYLGEYAENRSHVMYRANKACLNQVYTQHGETKKWAVCVEAAETDIQINFYQTVYKMDFGVTTYAPHYDYDIDAWAAAGIPYFLSMEDAQYYVEREYPNLVETDHPIDGTKVVYCRIYGYVVSEQTYVGGQLHGKSETFWNQCAANQRPREVANYYMGHLHGTVKQWSAQKKLTATKEYDMGQPTGQWLNATNYEYNKTTYVHGTPTLLERFNNDGVRLYRCTFDEHGGQGTAYSYDVSGKQWEIVEYAGGLKDGMAVTNWPETDNMQSTGLNWKGKKVGVWRYYFANGTLSKMTTYQEKGEEGQSPKKTIDFPGLLCGDSKYYYEKTGSLRVQGAWKLVKDKKFADDYWTSQHVGKWIYYHEDGSVRHTHEYK